MIDTHHYQASTLVLPGYGDCAHCPEPGVGARSVSSVQPDRRPHRPNRSQLVDGRNPRLHPLDDHA